MEKLICRNSDSRIVEFQIVNNFVSILRQNITEIISGYEKLFVLHCANNQLATIPEMKNLEILYCYSNQLTTIPEMKNLKRLYCANNQLTTIPEMKNLEFLHCNNNQLAAIPEMGNLIDLDCRDNQLTTIPEMGKLDRLYCRDNPLINAVTNCGDKHRTIIVLGEYVYIGCGRFTQEDAINEIKKRYGQEAADYINKVKQAFQLAEQFNQK